MAEPKEKNWWDEFAYMTPDEQAWVMAEHGLPYTSPADAGFAYPEDEEGLGGYPIPQIAGMPEFTSKGALDPMDLSQLNKQVDTSKDYAGLLVDNVLSMLSGGGAYDTSAFTPTYEYGNEVTMPGQSRLYDTAERGGWEGYVASKMAYENMTASQAMAALEDYVAIDRPGRSAAVQGGPGPGQRAALVPAEVQAGDRTQRRSGPRDRGTEVLLGDLRLRQGLQRGERVAERHLRG